MISASQALTPQSPIREIAPVLRRARPTGDLARTDGDGGQGLLARSPQASSAVAPPARGTAPLLSGPTAFAAQQARDAKEGPVPGEGGASRAPSVDPTVRRRAEGAYRQGLEAAPGFAYARPAEALALVA